jgi:hypothetical protein
MRQGRKFGSKWGFYYFSFDKKIVQHFIQCHIFTQSPPGRHPVISNHPFAPLLICVKTFHGEYCLVATVTHTQVYTVIYVYIHTYCSQHRHADRAIEIKKIWMTINALCQGNLSVFYFGLTCHKICQPHLQPCE